MPLYTQSQIQTLWRNNAPSHSDPVIASAIAMAESSGLSTSLNDNPATQDFSVGLWQINYFGSLLATRTKEFGPWTQLIQHPVTQVLAATRISGGGTDWSTWSTYRNGAYLAFMPGGSAPSAPPAVTNPTGMDPTAFLHTLANQLVDWVELYSTETAQTMAQAIAIFQSI